MELGFYTHQEGTAIAYYITSYYITQAAKHIHASNYTSTAKEWDSRIL